MPTFNIQGFIIKTRKCKKSDYAFVYGIMKKTLFPIIQRWRPLDKNRFDQSFRERYKNKVILMRGKRRIGFYELTVNGKSLDITQLFLSAAYQGKGIGTFLMRYFETLGYKKLTLQVWENNPAFKLYKRLGYKVVGKKKHKYSMEKVIS